MKVRGFLYLLFALAGAFVVVVKIFFLQPRPVVSANSGEVAENFAALDQNGAYFELYRHVESERSKAVVLISHGIGCPVLQKNMPTIQALVRHFAPLGVVFAFVNSNPHDTRAKLQEEAKKFNLEIPILLDPSQKIANGLKLTRTCEATLVETKKWQILYQGALDDRQSYGYAKLQADKHYLKDALDAHLTGSRIEVARTRGIGCVIPRIRLAEEPDYYGHIRPLLQRKCAACHTTDGAPPQNLGTYEDVKSWAMMIREVVRTRQMPPWEADSQPGEFEHDYSLSAEEEALLLGWIEGGMKQGAPRALPPEKAEPKIMPDLVYGPVETLVPAVTDKPWHYTPLGRAPADFWISSRRSVVSKRGLLQHIALLITKEPLDLSQEAFEPQFQNDGSNLITISRFTASKVLWSPYPVGKALKIPKDSYIYLEQHLALSGREDKVSVKIELQRYKGKRPPEPVVYLPLSRGDIKIPPGAEDFPVLKKYKMKETLSIFALGFHMHMHMHGMSAKLSALSPDGARTQLFSVPRYIFKNRSVYFLRKPIGIPAGTQLEMEGRFNNSERNPFGLDSSRWVEKGPDPEKNEMFQIHLYGY